MASRNSGAASGSQGSKTIRASDSSSTISTSSVHSVNKDNSALQRPKPPNNAEQLSNIENWRHEVNKVTMGRTTTISSPMTSFHQQPDSTYRIPFLQNQSAMPSQYYAADLQRFPSTITMMSNPPAPVNSDIPWKQFFQSLKVECSGCYLLFDCHLTHCPSCQSVNRRLFNSSPRS